MVEPPPIFVISLRRAEERRRFVARVFDELALPYQVVDAVDGSVLTDAERAQYSPWRAHYQLGRSFGQGTLACSLSHLRVMQEIVASDIAEAVVFEDDTEPLDGFRDVIMARDRFPRDRDVVTLISTFPSARPEPVGVSIGRYELCRFRRTPMGTQCYMVTARAARRVLDVAFPVCLPSDELLYRRRPAGLRVYGITPDAIRHHAFPSEISAAPEPAGSGGPIEQALLPAVGVFGRAVARFNRARDARNVPNAPRR